MRIRDTHNPHDSLLLPKNGKKVYNNQNNSHPKEFKTTLTKYTNVSNSSPLTDYLENGQGGKFSMIIFLYGADTFRSLEKLKSLKEKYLREVPNAHHNLILISGASATLQEIHDTLSAPPLLAKKRMIVLSDLLGKGNKKMANLALSFLERKNPEDIIIFHEGEIEDKTSPLFKKLKQEQYSQEFSLLKEKELKKWVINEAQKHEITISDAALFILQEIVGPDLWKMHQEIEKLSAYALASKERAISPSMVSLLVQGDTFEKNIFPFLDAVAAKDFVQISKLLEEQLAMGKSEISLIALLIGLLRNLIQIKNVYTQTPRPAISEIATLLKLHPFVVRKSLQSLKGFSAIELKEIYQALLQADSNLKSTRVLKPRVFIDLVLATMKHSANA
jgi:DNA polymerase-3 subunit delta